MTENSGYIKSILNSDVSSDIRSILVEFINNDTEKIDDLWNLIIESKNPLQWRAAWVFETICLNSKEILLSNLNNIIGQYKTTSNTSLLRMFGKLLCNIQIPKEYESFLFDITVKYSQDEKLPIAVRVNAMQLAYNISYNYPELKLELLNIFQLLSFRSGSKGFNNRLSKLIKGLSADI